MHGKILESHALCHLILPQWLPRRWVLRDRLDQTWFHLCLPSVPCRVDVLSTVAMGERVWWSRPLSGLSCRRLLPLGV